MSYVPIQQPQPIQSISFARIAADTIRVVCNGRVTDHSRLQEWLGKTVTLSDHRICIKKLGDKVKYIFPISSLVSINGVPWAGGSDYQLAIDMIMASIFGESTEIGDQYNQTIAFTAPAPAAHTDPPITLNGVSDSGLTVSYASSNNAVFTIAGNILTPVGAGTANITASQAGNIYYNAATNVVIPYTLT